MADVILVDERDTEIGVAPKLAAHQNGGRLHRAFSVFIFNSAGEMLLQRRSRDKYHFGGLWTNACCSHPRPGEDVLSSARRRLADEFGFTTPLREMFSFIYRAEDPGSGLTEHEYDHVLQGNFDGPISPNPAEIEQWRWMDCNSVREDIVRLPENYTPWFRQAALRVIGSMSSLG